MGVKANIDMDTDVDVVEADGDLGATGATCALAAADGPVECTIGTLPARLTFGSTGEQYMDTVVATADAGASRTLTTGGTVMRASGESTTMLMAGRRDECGAGAGRSGRLVVQGTRCA